MNIRSLMRGDGVVAGAALLLFIASFLDVASAGGFGSNAWGNLGLAMSMYVGGVIGAGLIVLSRSSAQPRKVAGLDVHQFGVALCVFAAWTALWTIIDFGGGPGVSRGAGLVLGFIAALILAFAAVATPLLPGLQAPLAPAPKPAAQAYGAGAQPAAGYGYPGQQPYGAGAGYGTPAAGTQGPHGGAPEFSPFWFAVPVARPLYGEDGSPSPIAELAPGTWYLAVEQRGPGLVAQTQDGRRGVLQDTTGIQRG
ncbi:hypothetical protein [Streptomyces fuscigenes]|uniref:hypothetical protein n=1 Tax=Streptomyces fuscigenes TaxID=1528880 RepID=UPI001F316413|nr:hypothetical protein [Streptomyces fuscigenes]MCF3963810.1 hypothetical protein [Streptomyces fuscigenes]